METKVFKPAQRIEEIEGRDTRAVIGYINELTEKAKSNSRLEARRLFEIGCVLNKDGIEMTTRDIAALLKISTRTLDEVKRLAKKFECNPTLFENDMEYGGFRSFGAIYKHYFGEKPQAGPTEWNKAKEEIHVLLRYYKQFPGNKELREALRQIRDSITRALPLQMQINDKIYMKFCECSCCGSEEYPEEGFDLARHPVYSYIEYPICESCREIKAEPDINKLFFLYANYAMSIDKAYELIRT